MTRTYLIVAILGCLLPSFGASAAQAQQGPPQSDPIGENLVPPDLLMRHQQEVGLTDEQRAFVEAEVRKTEARLAELQQQLQREVAAMGDLLKQERPMEQDVLAQLDKILEAERQIKRAHLAMALAIRNKLTREQQARIGEIRRQTAAAAVAQRGPEGAMPEPLRAKLRQVEVGAQRWQQSGRDPSRVVEVMRELEPLVRQGKFAEAEAVLDRALKLLRADEGSDEPDEGGDGDADSGEGDGKPDRADEHVERPEAALTPEALRASIEALRPAPAEHAWRQIPWMDCSLEALAEAKRRQKPVIAWVFLGSPGSERC